MIQRKSISFIEPVWRVIKKFEGEKLLYVQGLIKSLAAFDIILRLTPSLIDLGLPGDYSRYYARC